jgi:hypothetical protein
VNVGSNGLIPYQLPKPIRWGIYVKKKKRKRENADVQVGWINCVMNPVIFETEGE